MRLVRIYTAQPRDIATTGFAEARIERGIEALLPFTVILDRAGVFFLEDLTVLAKALFPIVIIDAVFGNLVDKEEGQAFDATRKQRFFLFQMALDGFANLDPTHIASGRIAVNITASKLNPVEKLNVAKAGIGIGHNLRDGKAVAISLKLPRGSVDVIVFKKALHALGNRTGSAELLELNKRARRLILGNLNVLQVKVAIGTAHVFELKALNLDTLDQTLVKSIKGIQNVNGIMMNAMRGRIVKTSKGMETLNARLSSGTAHLLRLIQNDNGIICCDHIDGAAARELIALGIHDSSLL